jgi:putative FmdB family regulatory protein
MPIYEYRCKSCGKEFEDFFQAGEDEDVRKCPRCGKKEVERMVSTFCSAGSVSRGSSGCAPSGGFR